MQALHQPEPKILFDVTQKVNAWCCWHISGPTSWKPHLAFSRNESHGMEHREYAFISASLAAAAHVLLIRPKPELFSRSCCSWGRTVERPHSPALFKQHNTYLKYPHLHLLLWYEMNVVGNLKALDDLVRIPDSLNLWSCCAKLSPRNTFKPFYPNAVYYLDFY